MLEHVGVCRHYNGGRQLGEKMLLLCGWRAMVAQIEDCIIWGEIDLVNRLAPDYDKKV